MASKMDVAQILRSLQEKTSTSNLIDIAGGIINNYTADLSSVSFVAVAAVPAEGTDPQFQLVYGENKLDGKPILTNVPAKVDATIHDALVRTYLWAFLSTVSRAREDRGTAYMLWVNTHGQAVLDLIGDRIMVGHFPKASLSTQEVLLSEAVAQAKMRCAPMLLSKEKYGVSKIVTVRTKSGEPEDLSQYVII